MPHLLKKPPACSMPVAGPAFGASSLVLSSGAAARIEKVVLTVLPADENPDAQVGREPTCVTTTKAVLTPTRSPAWTLAPSSPLCEFNRRTFPYVSY